MMLHIPVSAWFARECPSREHAARRRQQSAIRRLRRRGRDYGCEELALPPGIVLEVGVLNDRQIASKPLQWPDGWLRPCARTQFSAADTSPGKRAATDSTCSTEPSVEASSRYVVSLSTPSGRGAAITLSNKMPTNSSSLYSGTKIDGFILLGKVVLCPGAGPAGPGENEDHYRIARHERMPVRPTRRRGLRGSMWTSRQKYLFERRSSMGILVTASLGIPLLFYAALRRYGHEWRAAAIIAATFWGIAVTLITEILSVWNGVAVAWLAAAWLLMIALASCYLYRAAMGDRGQRPFLAAVRKAVTRLIATISRWQ